MALDPLTNVARANDKYRTQLRATWIADPPDTSLLVKAVPANVPTIVTVGYGTDLETVFRVEGKSGDSSSNYVLTGVTRLKGANQNLPENTAVNCLNHEEFFNQYEEKINEVIAALNTSGNLIINGNFDVWQRGTSGFTANGYTADRWRLSVGSGATVGVSRQDFTAGQTDVPNEPTHFLRLNRTVAGTGASLLEQRIEDVRTLAGKTVTLSFYAKGSLDGSNMYFDTVQNFGSGGSASVDGSNKVLTGLSTSWQKFTFTVSLDSISGKTVGTSSFLQIRFVADTAAGTGTFDIAQVQLNAGSVALPFMPKSFGEELRACQRYCWVSSPAERTHLGTASYRNGTTLVASATFPVTMRKAPTMSQNSTNSGVFTASGAVALLSAAGPASFVASKDGFSIDFPVASVSSGFSGSFSVRGDNGFFLTADAEL